MPHENLIRRKRKEDEEEDKKEVVSPANYHLHPVTDSIDDLCNRLERTSVDGTSLNMHIAISCCGWWPDGRTEKRTVGVATPT